MDRVERITINGMPRVDSCLVRRVEVGAPPKPIAPVATAFPRLATLLPIASSFLTCWSRFFPDSTLRQYAPKSAEVEVRHVPQGHREPPPRLVAGDILPSLELTTAWAAFSR